MKIVSFDDIKNMNISPFDCFSWVDDIFYRKSEAVLPPKVSIKLDGNVFVNTMPTYLPYLNRFGVKVVSRFPSHAPAVQSELLLYDFNSGNCLALLDATWITAWRTAAVASLAITKLKKSNAKVFAFIGLGNIARATFAVLNTVLDFNNIEVRLLRYKTQAEEFIDRFKDIPDLNFKIYDDVDKLISGSDVVVSSLTAADSILARDDSFDPGVLVVPIHTRGFQNCDLFFDRVIVDDVAHVAGFKYFDKFSNLAELSDVLHNPSVGRNSDSERIIAYNIGLAISDVYFASKIYDRLADISVNTIELNHPTTKFWI